MSPIAPELWRLLSRWQGYTYGRLDHAARKVDCSSLGSSLLRDHYGASVITREVWQAINLSRPGVGPWDGIEALAAALGGDLVAFSGPDRPRKDRLIACQVWRDLGPDWEIVPDRPGRQGSRGHFFFALGRGGWEVVVIEATHDVASNGVRVWHAGGATDAAQAVDIDGRLLIDPLDPIDLDLRLEGWDAVVWTELP